MNEQGIFGLCKGAPNARFADCCDQCRYGQNIGILMGVGTCEKFGGRILEITVCDSFERKEHGSEQAE